METQESKPFAFEIGQVVKVTPGKFVGTITARVDYGPNEQHQYLLRYADRDDLPDTRWEREEYMTLPAGEQ